MSQNYGPCGKCGKPMPVFTAIVYPVTWCGQPVCGECADEVRDLNGKEERAENWETQFERGASSRAVAIGLLALFLASPADAGVIRFTAKKIKKYEHKIGHAIGHAQGAIYTAAGAVGKAIKYMVW